MLEGTREVVVTGIGLVSAAGEGAAAHLAALDARAEPHLQSIVPPYAVHPVAALDWDRQIPKKSDQRQMEPWQRLGVYAAGLALDHAGLKGDAEAKARMHLVVAAGGGERDYAVDGAILTGLKGAADPGAFLNERLMSDLRPTLFLAQLSNLLAGNVSIVHGVTGASRTFMGEEASGVDALRIAQGRIAHRQTDLFLVGSSYNAERPDVLVTYEMAGLLWKHPFRPVFEREPEGGFLLGSAAAFLVLEAREHAEARGAKPLAVLSDVASDLTRRAPGSVAESLKRLWWGMGAGAEPLVVSGATGTAGITAEEQGALEALAPTSQPLAAGDLLGHPMEAQALAGAALAAALIEAGRGEEAVVTTVGHRRGEGLVRLTRLA